MPTVYGRSIFGCNVFILPAAPDFVNTYPTDDCNSSSNAEHDVTALGGRRVCFVTEGPEKADSSASPQNDILPNPEQLLDDPTDD